MHTGRRGGAAPTTVTRGAILALALSPCTGLGSGSAAAQSGYQVINGTQVFTVVDQPRGIATFSNACGSQTLTQSQLQAGAIPNAIIPCSKGIGSAGRTPSIPAVPGGANNVAIGLGLLQGALGVAAAVQSAAPEPDGGGSTGGAIVPASPGPSFRGDDGTDGVATAERDGSRLSSAQARNVAQMQYDEAAQSNRDRKYCESQALFEEAAAHFHRAGDGDRANDARFQASLTAADCVDEQRRKADEKHVYWCVDEDNVYGKGWRPDKPGEGCGPENKPYTDATGALKKPRDPEAMRKELRRRLQEQNAESAKSSVPAPAAEDGPDMTSLRDDAQLPAPDESSVAAAETPDPPSAPPSAQDDFMSNFMAHTAPIPDNGQKPMLGLTPLENAFEE